jgi:tetratricopeptide (TPR) repeat protein
VSGREALAVSDLHGRLERHAAVSEPSPGPQGADPAPARETPPPLDRPLCRVADEAPRADEYERVLARYLEGRTGEALASLTSCPPFRLEGALRTILKDTSNLAVVAALHTEAALRLARSGDARGSVALVALTEEWVFQRLGRLGATHRERQEGFWRTWLLRLGSYRQAHGDPGGAERLFALCRKEFLGDAGAWLAGGTVYEARLSTETLSSASTSGGAPGIERRAAERHYRAALERDPSLVEAHVRLGRVLALGGNLEEAEGELDWVTREGHDSFLIAFAWLFKGEIAESRGEPLAAAECYRFALELEPEMQPALLALSRTLRAAGMAGLAREVLLSVLPAMAGRERSLWSEYRRGLGRTALRAAWTLQADVERERRALVDGKGHGGRGQRGDGPAVLDRGREDPLADGLDRGRVEHGQ